MQSNDESTDGDGNLVEFEDVFQVIVDLYNKKEDVLNDLQCCRINPTFNPTKFLRNDIEYYLPQLCNFLVFHENFKNPKLKKMILDICQINFFFAHSLFWYLNSLQNLISPKKMQRFLN